MRQPLQELGRVFDWLTKDSFLRSCSRGWGGSQWRDWAYLEEPMSSFALFRRKPLTQSRMWLLKEGGAVPELAMGTLLNFNDCCGTELGHRITNLLKKWLDSPCCTSWKQLSKHHGKYWTQADSAVALPIAIIFFTDNTDSLSS
jgi:hypothetical protein